MEAARPDTTQVPDERQVAEVLERVLAGVRQRPVVGGAPLP
ncbi:MAG TPA: hypothetical protein VNJ70_04890 [Thermoanaerobaculia bacterium]|nr:hypothetical protein [Thermoanaerobaculia bacterium]